jgi:hypothetical protein
MKTIQELSVSTLKKDLKECSEWIARTIKFIADLQEGRKYNNFLQVYETLDKETLIKRDMYIKNNMKLILEQYELKSNIEAALKAKKA